MHIDYCACQNALTLTKLTGPVERKALQCVLSDEETQFQKEFFKILNIMYENIYQIRAIFQRGPFSVNPHSCAILGENIFPNKPIIL